MSGKGTDLGSWVQREDYSWPVGRGELVRSDLVGSVGCNVINTDTIRQNNYTTSRTLLLSSLCLYILPVTYYILDATSAIYRSQEKV